MIVVVARLFDFDYTLFTHDALIISDILLCAVLLSYFKDRHSRRIEYILIACSLLLNAVESFLFSHFGYGIIPQVLSFVAETSPKESFSFITAYLLSFRTFYVLIPYCIIFAVCSFLYKKQSGLAKWIVNHALIYRLTFVIPIFAIVLQIFGFKLRLQFLEVVVSDNTDAIEKAYNGAYTPSQRIAYCIFCCEKSSRELRIVANHIAKTTASSIATIQGKSEAIIVLYIGESYARHHSALYGYHLPTTPNQCLERDAGRLIVMEDAVSYANFTSMAWKNMLSLNDPAKGGQWYDAPLFPAMFRKAGYHVSLLTSQFVQMDNVFSFLGSFFINAPELSQQMFDYRNKHQYTYDEEIIQHLENTISSDSLNHRLIILNGSGQHFDYNKNYPDSFLTRFNANQYMRSGNHQTESQILADYDNATLYNDYVMGKLFNLLRNHNAIVVFLSDHGEVLYDDGEEHFGHASVSFDSPAICHEYEIPMWFWCSDRYIANNNAIYSQLKQNANLPFLSSDLSHTILNLADIKTPSLDLTRSIASDHYNPSRQRMLRGIVDYNVIKKR